MLHRVLVEIGCFTGDDETFIEVISIDDLVFLIKIEKMPKIADERRKYSIKILTKHGTICWFYLWDISNLILFLEPIN